MGRLQFFELLAPRRGFESSSQGTMDPEAAFRILSERTQCDHGPCNHHAPLPKAELLPETSPELAAELETLDVCELLLRFKGVQEGRVAVYRQFENGFQQLLDNQNLEEYQEHCAATTREFGGISMEIRAVESRLREISSEEGSLQLTAAEHIRTLQLHEKEKLQLTAAMQIARQRRASAMLLEETNEENMAQFEGLVEREITDMESRLTSTLEAINEELQNIQAIIIDASEL